MLLRLGYCHSRPPMCPCPYSLLSASTHNNLSSPSLLMYCHPPVSAGPPSPVKGLDVLGTWGPGGPSEGQLDAAKSAALESLNSAVADKDERRKAAAKVGRPSRDRLLWLSASRAVLTLV